MDGQLAETGMMEWNEETNRPSCYFIE
ncbi:hypothetical protein S96127_4361 (plasmid) [Yersinia pestis]|nr:hypothetical protein S96127_4361 [Yersinia pestis]